MSEYQMQVLEHSIASIRSSKCLRVPQNEAASLGVSFSPSMQSTVHTISQGKIQPSASTNVVLEVNVVSLIPSMSDRSPQRDIRYLTSPVRKVTTSDPACSNESKSCA